MRRTSLASLILVTIVVMTIGVLVLLELTNRRYYLASISPAEWLAVAALAVGTVVLGRRVRAYLKGDRPGLDPIRAARTLAWAKAASYTGAILLGRYLATALVAGTDWQIAAQRERVVAAAIAALCALALTAAGVIVERWCQLPPPDEKATAPRNSPELPEPS